MMWLLSAIVLILFFALLSIVWTTWIYGIGPTPTSPKVRQALFTHLPPVWTKSIYELGAGFGTLTWPLTKKYPYAPIKAVEVSFFPWVVMKIRQLIQPNAHLTILWKNFLLLPLKKDALLICYLFPDGMQKLEQKLLKENFHGIVISHTFAFRHLKPHEQFLANDLYLTPIYIYLFKEEIGKN